VVEVAQQLHLAECAQAEHACNYVSSVSVVQTGICMTCCGRTV
jgi:hypothetical protein